MNVPSTPDAIVPPDFIAPFDDQLGLRFTELGPDGARAQLEVTPKLLQPMGLVHGGVYCSMIESMASVAAYTWFNASGNRGNVVGVNNNTDFLRSIDSGTVHGRAEPIHRGRRIGSALPCTVPESMERKKSVLLLTPTTFPRLPLALNQ